MNGKPLIKPLKVKCDCEACTGQAPPTEDWEKRLEKDFVPEISKSIAVKSFIRSEISKAYEAGKKEERERIVEIAKDILKFSGINGGRAISELLTKLTKQVCSST